MHDKDPRPEWLINKAEPLRIIFISPEEAEERLKEIN